MSIRRLEFDEADAIQRVTDTLTTNFADRYSDAEVIAAVDRAHRSFDGAPIREFVPMMVEGIVRRELRTNGTAAGADSPF